ncbi:MAG: DUF4838 domain-containing protein, partial [Clostridia bacterium]|nr:DUF4838 domain-containing protein [Clostridia bacterium]
IDLVKNGQSEYRIVIPDEASEIVAYAATEIELNVKKSTGIALPVVTSTEAGRDLSGYNLSLGETALAKAANVKGDGLKETGFTVSVKENTLVMIGGGDYGTLHAAYEFLEKNFGYQYYAEDEIYIDSVYNAKLLDFNYTYQPPIEYTNLSTRSANTGNGLYRYKIHTTRWPIGWPHSYTYLLPTKTYPQYYKTGAKLLCLSDRNMWDDMAAAVIGKLEEDPTAKFVMLGAEDAWGQCSCDDCNASNEKYTYTGTYILFANYVAKKVREHFDAVDPTREANVMILAYFDSRNPPVKTDADGNVTLLYDELKGESNLYVQVCLVNQDFASSIYGEQNKASYMALKNWKLVTNNLWSYIYDGWEVNNNLYHFFDWEYKTDTINALTELGYEQVQWEMSSSTVKVSGFEKLRAYYTAELIYDPTQDANKLIGDFITQYYKEAAPYIQEYFDMLNVNFKLYQNKMALENKYVTQHSQLGLNKYSQDKGLWSELMLDKALELFDKALQAIQESDAYSGAQRDIMLLRVEQERLIPRRYKLELYETSYTSEEYARLVDEFNIDVANFGGTVRLDK